MSKSMMLMMPIMSILFTFTLPAGVGLYWIVSNLAQMVQQYLPWRISRRRRKTQLLSIQSKRIEKTAKKHR